MKVINPVVGSPPREWGQPSRRNGVMNRSSMGFTPTRVGTAKQVIAFRIVTGSPPREWGQLPGAPPSIDALPGCRVHPHASGDSTPAASDVPYDSVSRFTPTRVGTADHRGRSTGLRFCGFTPTRVGTALTIAHADGFRPMRFTPTRVGTAANSRSPATVAELAQGFTPTRVGTAHAVLTRGVPVGSGFTPTRVGTVPGGRPCPACVPSGSPPREWGQHCRSTDGLMLLKGSNRVHPHASGDSPRMAIVSIQHCDYQRPIRRWSA